jgi:hypothetical protein
MPPNTPRRRSQYDRASIIQAVQTPLGFFVLALLVIEAIFGIVASLREGPDRTYLVIGMIGLLFSVIAIVAFLLYSGRGQALLARSGEAVKSSRYSLLVGPPEDMPDLDIAVIDWDDGECFIIGTKLREPVRLVPTRVGPSFRVQIPQGVLDNLEPEDSLELQLKDKKGNHWRVRRFFIFENLLPLLWAEERYTVRQAYGEGLDEQ